MTPAKEVLELCRGEFSRRRLPLRFAALCGIGIVSLALLGMIAHKAINSIDLSDPSQRASLDAQGMSVATLFGFVPIETAHKMVEEAVPVTIFYGTAIPFAFAWVFLALLGFDYWAGPVSQRTWRYYLPRVRRSSLLVVGIVLLFAASIIAILGTSLFALGFTFVFYKDPALTPTLYWTLRLAFAALLSVLPDIGLLCFCGIVSKSGTQALLRFIGYTIFLKIGLRLTQLAGASENVAVQKISYLRYLSPSNFHADYLSIDGSTFAVAMVMSLVLSALFIGAAFFVTQRREL